MLQNIRDNRTVICQSTSLEATIVIIIVIIIIIIIMFIISSSSDIRVVSVIIIIISSSRGGGIVRGMLIMLGVFMCYSARLLVREGACQSTKLY